MTTTDSSPKQWYVARWPALAWLETGIKLVALGIGIRAGVNAFAAGAWAMPQGAGWIAAIVLIVLAVGLLAAIGDRLADREAVAMVFVILNNLGHWGMVAAFFSAAGPGGAADTFAGLMLAGDLVKIGFIRAHDFTVRDYPQRLLYILTGVYIVGYLLILIF